MKNPTIDQIQNKVYESLSVEYKAYIETIYQAAINRDDEAFHLANRIFNLRLPKINRCNENAINPIIPWINSPIWRLVIENKIDACQRLLYQDNSQLWIALRAAGFVKNIDLIIKLMNAHSGLNASPFAHISYTSDDVTQSFHGPLWPQAVIGAAITNDALWVTSVIHEARKQDYIAVDIAHIVYGAAFSGHFDYAKKHINENNLEEAIMGAASGGHMYQAEKWIENASMPINLLRVSKVAASSGQLKYAEILSSRHLMSSYQNAQLAGTSHIQLHIAHLERRNDIIFSERAVAMALNAISLQQKIRINLSNMESFRIASNYGALVFLACLSNDTRETYDSKMNVKAFFPHEIWLLILNFIFGLNEYLYQDRLDQIGCYIAKIIKTSIFSHDSVTKKAVKESDYCGCVLS